jgi:hypothetical protein
LYSTAVVDTGKPKCVAQGVSFRPAKSSTNYLDLAYDACTIFCVLTNSGITVGRIVILEIVWQEAGWKEIYNGAYMVSSAALLLTWAFLQILL